MSFAYTGMLGVFLTALLTRRRGNTASVLAALAAGVVVTTLLQDGIYGWWTRHLFGSPHKLAQFWWMPIGTVICFLICVSGRARPRDPDKTLVQPAQTEGFPVLSATEVPEPVGRSCPAVTAPIQ
jgi:hypothetical protein